MQQTPQEHLPSNNPQGNFGIQHFQQEIGKLKKQELGLADSVHLEDVDPDQLTLADEEMWNMVEGILASKSSVENFMPQFDAYRNGATTKTSKQFAGYLANKLSPLRMKQYIATQKKQLFD